MPLQVVLEQIAQDERSSGQPTVERDERQLVPRCRARIEFSIRDDRQRHQLWSVESQRCAARAGNIREPLHVPVLKSIPELMKGMLVAYSAGEVGPLSVQCAKEVVHLFVREGGEARSDARLLRKA